MFREHILRRLNLHLTPYKITALYLWHKHTLTLFYRVVARIIKNTMDMISRTNLAEIFFPRLPLAEQNCVPASLSVTRPVMMPAPAGTAVAYPDACGG